MILHYSFYILLSVIIYSYIIYPIAIWLLASIKRIFTTPKKNTNAELPNVTLFVCAYNEGNHIVKKLENSLKLNYPKDKLEIVFITDGSTDNSQNSIKETIQVKIFHQAERKGKTEAINRGMQFITNPIVIFTDCNTLIAENSILEIVYHFQDSTVGCVAGEKRILDKELDKAVNAGEGFYWQYESHLKQNEAFLNSTVGAAGELFGIRRELFNPIPSDTILDDLIISLKIAQNGYKIKYASKAYSLEMGSATVADEMKRKTRIASGGAQAITRLTFLLNPLKYKLLSVQYISHKFLRWTIIPFSLPIIFILNILLTLKYQSAIIDLLLVGQIIIYLLVALGFLLRNKAIRIKIIFIPYYIFMMNYCQIIGWHNYLKGNYTAVWERVKRGE